VLTAGVEPNRFTFTESLEILELGCAYAFFFQQDRDIVLHPVNDFAVFGDQTFLQRIP